MIVFPILNFVLPLMLTSFIFVNSHGCNECKGQDGLRINEVSEHDDNLNKKSIKMNGKVLNKNVGNVN